MRLLLLTFFALLASSAAEVPSVPKSQSPDGKLHAVMDIDRDPKISPEWKGGSFPQIEITEKETKRVLVSIPYFGAHGGDARPLREHVRVSWRLDSTAFAINIFDRFYVASVVYVLDKEGEFIPAPIPTDYEKLTGFPTPDVKHLRPRGSYLAGGWDIDGRLLYNIFLSPLPSFTGTDPLQHLIYLQVTPEKVTPVKVVHETGEWKNGDWIQEKKDDWLPLPDKYVWPEEQDDAPEFKSAWTEFTALPPRIQSAVKTCWPDTNFPIKVETAEADLNNDGISEIFVGIPAYSGSGGTGYSILKQDGENFKDIGGLLGFGIKFLPAQNKWLQIEGRSNAGGGHHTRYLLRFERNEYRKVRIENHDLINKKVTVRIPDQIQEDLKSKPEKRSQ